MGNSTEVIIRKNNKQIFQIELGRSAKFSVQDYEDFAKGVLSAKKMIGSFEIEVSDDYSEDSDTITIKELLQLKFECGKSAFMPTVKNIFPSWESECFWSGYFYGGGGGLEGTQAYTCAYAQNEGMLKKIGYDHLGCTLFFVNSELSDSFSTNGSLSNQEVIKASEKFIFTKNGVAPNPKNLTIVKGDKVDIHKGEILAVHNERAQKVKLLQSLTKQIAWDEKQLLLKKEKKTQLEKELGL